MNQQCGSEADEKATAGAASATLADADAIMGEPEEASAGRAGSAVGSGGGDPVGGKRVRIFAGGFKSNEEYTYVRGRGRGRYVCEECGIRCKKPSMLKKHIRTHTDLRPYTCRQCNFSFKTKGLSPSAFPSFDSGLPSFDSGLPSFQPSIPAFHSSIPALPSFDSALIHGFRPFHPSIPPLSIDSGPSILGFRPSILTFHPWIPSLHSWTPALLSLDSGPSIRTI